MYIKKTISEGEEIVGIFDITGWLFLGLYIQLAAGALIGIVLYAMKEQAALYFSLNEETSFYISVAILVFSFFIVAKTLYLILYYDNIEMGVTNKRVVYKEGIISTKTAEVRLNAIETIDIKQSVLGSVFNFGDVHITGTGGAEITFPKVKSPMSVKQVIASTVNKYVREQPQDTHM